MACGTASCVNVLEVILVSKKTHSGLLFSQIKLCFGVYKTGSAGQNHPHCSCNFRYDGPIAGDLFHNNLMKYQVFDRQITKIFIAKGFSVANSKENCNHLKPI